MATEHRQNQLHALADWCAQRARTGGAVVVLHGPRGSGRAATAQAIATSASLPLLMADVGILRSGPESWRSTVDLCYREARLRGAALLWQGADILLIDGEPARELTDILDQAGSVGDPDLRDHRRELGARRSLASAVRTHFLPGTPTSRAEFACREQYLPAHDRFASSTSDSATLVRSLAGAFSSLPVRSWTQSRPLRPTRRCGIPPADL